MIGDVNTYGSSELPRPRWIQWGWRNLVPMDNDMPFLEAVRYYSPYRYFFLRTGFRMLRLNKFKGVSSMDQDGAIAHYEGEYMNLTILWNGRWPHFYWEADNEGAVD